MNNRGRPLLVFAAIAILIAVAANRRSSEDPELKARLAALQSEVARLRAARPGPEASAAPESPVPPTPTPQPQAPPANARSRNESRRRLQAAGSVVDREEKMTLLRDLLGGSDASLNSRALAMLREFRGPDAAALAAGVLRKEGPSWLRAQAASVLGEMAEPSALPALLEAAQAEDLDVRASAASSLDRLGHSAPLHDLIGLLSGMLEHHDRGKREDAVFLLSSLQSPSALPPLVRALGDATNSRVREAAAEALGRSKFDQAIPPLEAALDDPEPQVRDAARRAIDALRARR
jgi:HEAT repeat protein